MIPTNNGNGEERSDHDRSTRFVLFRIYESIAARIGKTVISVYRPGHWSRNTSNSMFAFQIIVGGFPLVMIIVRKVPFRIGIALLGIGVAIKPTEGDGTLRIEWT